MLPSADPWLHTAIASGAAPDNAPVPDAPVEPAAARGYSLRSITNPIPLHSSINLQPTYKQSSDSGGQAYLNLKAILVVEAGVPLVSRIEWPVPEVDTEHTPTTVGIGDLTWLNLFRIVSTSTWGDLTLGPVFVFPTASRSEMGQGKYQVGPALGYVNDAVEGWQFALLVQQYFSFAGDPTRSRVNQVTIQPFVTKLLPHAWYVQTQPVITVNFAKATNSVPLNLVVGKVIDGRWNFNVQVSVFPRWTSPPSNDFQVIFNVGYQFPPLFSRK